MCAELLKQISPKVLLVEDDLLARKITTRLLSIIGCEVDNAANGEEAFTRVGKQYKVMLVDLGLPGISGLELAHKIKTEKPNIKVLMIALTGRSDKMVKAECLATGFSEFILKPASTDVLAKAIFKLLKAQ